MYKAEIYGEAVVRLGNMTSFVEVRHERPATSGESSPNIACPFPLLSHKVIRLSHLEVLTMDEIAPEYDVVVLGTGASIDSSSTPPY